MFQCMLQQIETWYHRVSSRMFQYIQCNLECFSICCNTNRTDATGCNLECFSICCNTNITGTTGYNLECFSIYCRTNRTDTTVYSRIFNYMLWHKLNWCILECYFNTQKVIGFLKQAKLH